MAGILCVHTHTHTLHSGALIWHSFEKSWAGPKTHFLSLLMCKWQRFVNVADVTNSVRKRCFLLTRGPPAWSLAVLLFVASGPAPGLAFVRLLRVWLEKGGGANRRICKIQSGGHTINARSGTWMNEDTGNYGGNSAVKKRNTYFLVVRKTSLQIHWVHWGWWLHACSRCCKGC